MRERLLDIVSIDTRSRGALRIGVALLVLGDLTTRAPWLLAHYTDHGVLPRWLLFQHHWSEGLYSLHTMSGEVWLQALLFAVAATFAGMMLVGRYTWTATVGTFVLMCSLHSRNPMVLHSGDVLLRLRVFWGLFVPLGAVWAVDARRRDMPAPRQVASAGTLALLLQVCFVYWWSTPLEGTTPSRLIVTLPWLLGPVVAWIPWRTGQLRTATVSVFIALHLCLALFMPMGLFPLIGSVAWLVFLPPWFWERVEARVIVLHAAVQPRVELQLRSALRTAMALSCLSMIIAWNAGNAWPSVAALISPELRAATHALHLDQVWNRSLFPVRADGWWSVQAELADGSTVDLNTGEAVTNAKPAEVGSHTIAHPWRKYLFNLWAPSNLPDRRAWVDYLRRQWDETHDPSERVLGLRLVSLEEENTVDSPPTPAKPNVRLWLRYD